MSEKRSGSGIILVSVLWVIIILSMAALALSHLSTGSMALLDVSAGQVRAYAAARAGVAYVEDLLAHSKTASRDTLFQCGVDLQGRTREKLFREIKVGDSAHFDITYTALGYSYDGSGISVFGLEDEERRLNLNALNSGNAYIFSLLLQQFDVDALSADRIAAAVAEWKDPAPPGGSTASAGIRAFGSFNAKHKPYEVAEEILAIDGMAPAIFERIRDYITVFPKTGDLKVNLATASRPLMHALTGRVKQQDVLVDQLTRQRDGKDGVPFTEDDGVTGGVVVAPDDIEASRILNLDTGVTSRFFRVHVTGVDEVSGARSFVEAVVDTATDQGGTALVFWRRGRG